MTRRATTDEGRKLTIRYQIIEALKHRGSVEMLGNITRGPKTVRYAVYSHPTANDRYYYVGQAGALRLGPTVRASIGLSDGFKTSIINQWRQSQGLPLIRIESFESRIANFVPAQNILTDAP